MAHPDLITDPSGSRTPGRNTPVVLLHGVGLDHTMWDRVSALLDRDIVALDLPGHGTQPPLREPQTLASLADDVMTRMPGGSVHLVGFSLGALVAQHIARFHPERIATLSCVSSVCRRTPDEAAAVAARLDAARSDFSGSVAAALERWYPATGDLPAEVRTETARMLNANDVASYLFAYEVFATSDREIGPELGNIDVPTLAITGEFDAGSTPAMSRRLADEVPGARFVVVPGARHMLPVDAAPALAEALEKFIRESEGDGRD